MRSYADLPRPTGSKYDGEKLIAPDDIYKAPQDTWARLAAPLDADTIAWRQDGKAISRDGRFLARFVAYVEANTVRERLDAVVPGEWDSTLTPLPNLAGENGSPEYAVKCRLQVLGVVREDVGQGRDWKQAATDAFKRAAVRFGIAHELYDYGQNWVEVDGDGKYSKPLEDPAVAYARKHSGEQRPASSASRGERRPEEPRARSGNSSDASSQSSNAPARSLEEESCPKCGGRMFDNRLTKRNPRAPDFKCRDRSCDGVIWPPKPGEKVTRGRDHEEKLLPGEEPEHPGAGWMPLPGAPMIPDDDDLPF